MNKEEVRAAIDSGKFNPRWVCWSASRGESPEYRSELAVDPDDGKTYPRTLIFMLWIQARWREWATELGFKSSQWGEAHRTALASGRTEKEFDAWLRAKVGIDG